MQFNGRDAGAEVGEAAGDEEVAAGDGSGEGLDGAEGFLCVDVVEDEEPAGVEVEPFESGGDLEALVFFALLGEVEHEGAAEGGEVALEGLGAVGTDKEEGVVVVGVLPCVLDGGAGFADAAHAENGVAFQGGGMAGGKVFVQSDEGVLAADEVIA